MAKVMLPKKIDPIQLADSHQILTGDLALEKMERLAGILFEKKGLASVDLKFGRDAEGYPYILGSIKTEVTIVCQRCNKPMLLQLEIAVEMSPVFSDKQGQQLPKNYDPLLLSGDTISLSLMVEEEILLSIPIVPRHPTEECPVQVSQLSELAEEEKPNPFAVLKKLLRE